MSQQEEQEQPWDVPFERMSFDEGHCFLCGEAMLKGGTQEHVIPKWLLRRFDLWDRSLNLLNGSDIPYRQLTVPCCNRCNTQGLANLEGQIQRAVDSGYEAVKGLDSLALFQWCGKIFFGIIFREMSLLADRANPSAGSITTPELLKGYSNLHGFLQSIYREAEFIGRRPFSVLVANLHRYEPEPFDFVDNLPLMVVGFRLGKIGIIVSLQDSGIAEETYGRYLDEVGGRKLHAIQYDEVLAKVIYDRSRLRGVPTYLFAVQEGSTRPFQVSVVSAPPAADPYDTEELAHFLAFYWRSWGYTFDSIFQDGLVRSSMSNERGELVLLGPEREVVATESRDGNLAGP